MPSNIEKWCCYIHKMESTFISLLEVRYGDFKWNKVATIKLALLVLLFSFRVIPTKASLFYASSNSQIKDLNSNNNH